MNLIEAIKQRHSVRSYQSKPLPQDVISQLQEKIDELNAVSGLNMQLVVNEKRAFAGINSYGAFHGVENYLVIAGQKSDDLDERAGYYGEMFVLYAQILGLNTCWVGLTYRKQKERYALADDEKIACVITVGYGVTQGHGHKIKRVEQVAMFQMTVRLGFVKALRQPCWPRQLSINSVSSLNCSKFETVECRR